MAKDAQGMRGNRLRSAEGTLRRKRGDTHVGTIEELYDKNFDVRADMHLETLLQKEGVTSLNDLLHGRPDAKTTE